MSGYYYHPVSEDCREIMYYPTNTPPLASHEVENEVTGDKLRLVRGEGVCQDEMSGRVETFFKDVGLKTEYVGVIQVRENDWFTISDYDFDEIAADNVCKTMFGMGAIVDTIHLNSQCGRAETRVWHAKCTQSTISSSGYNYPQGCYSYDLFPGPFWCPDGCSGPLSNPQAGCTNSPGEVDQFGCDFDFQFNLPDDKQHAAVSCKCRPGFDLIDSDSPSCERDSFPEIETPIDSANVVIEVDTVFGKNQDFEHARKLRLVNEGACSGYMEGRLEMQFGMNLADLPEYVEILEIYEGMWFTIGDSDFDGNSADYACRTIFGQNTESSQIFNNSQCGVSESRVWTHNCDGINGETLLDFPEGCTPSGPFRGCTAEGCELELGLGGFADVIPENEQHVGLSCTCKSGFSIDTDCLCLIGYELINDDCTRIEYPEITTPTPDYVVKEVNVTEGRLRLVSGEGVCQDDMSGRIEVFYDDLAVRTEFDGILEVNEGMWFTINDASFDAVAGDLVCKTLFGNNSVINDYYQNSQCGFSESRVLDFTCNNTTIGSYPNACVQSGLFAGCTAEGCELAIPNGFPNVIIENEQHAAVSCACDSGFTRDSRCVCPVGYDLVNDTCARNIYPEMTTPTPNFIVQHVNITGGQLRLVSGEGVCQDDMSGRIEVLYDDLVSREEFEGILEVNEGMWFTVADSGFDEFAGDLVCQTLFGNNSEINQLYQNSQCGLSESRVWEFHCGANSTMGNGTMGNGTMGNSTISGYPDECLASGPFAGCTAEGCELAIPNGFSDVIPGTQQHAAVSCKCRAGYEFVSDGGYPGDDGESSSGSGQDSEIGSGSSGNDQESTGSGENEGGNDDDSSSGDSEPGSGQSDVGSGNNELGSGNTEVGSGNSEIGGSGDSGSGGSGSGDSGDRRRRKRQADSESETTVIEYTTPKNAYCRKIED